jgi:signal transduction histidine kinase
MLTARLPGPFCMIDHPPIRLLLVEDNPGDARLVREHLADAAGSHCFVLADAPTLADAAGIAASAPFDIVLLDLSLPDSSGLETLARWRSTAPELPVIVLTGSDDEELAIAAVREGAQDYLVKGRIDGGLLAQAIRYAIERKHVQEDLERAKAGLERRVEERTAELREINARLQSEIAERTLAQQQAAELLQREQAQRVLVESANRSKDEFLAVLSHELRTPLNAILGWAEILHGGDSSPAEVREGVEIIERNARAQARLVEDVLEVSRIVCGKVRLKLTELDLATVIDAAVTSARPAAAARDVALLRTGDDDAPTSICGDADRLQQIVSNLLSNAIKFTLPGGTVRVASRRLDHHAQICVSDTGIGIKADFLPFVFDRFRQADASSTRNHGGLGLGLSITRHLVEMHGGSIRAASEGEGLGSAFTVSLPLRTSHGALTAELSPCAEFPVHCPNGTKLSALEGLRVLVVDDEPDSRGVVARLLTRARVDVREAASALEAARTLQSWDADLVISDIAMPGEDGYSLLRRLRASPEERLRTLPGLALTAFVRPEDVQQAAQAGFSMHLAKPVEPAALFSAVASLARPGARAASKAR